MSLFRNKYRNESARLPKWDYSAEGYYFITICTKPRRNLFGQVVNKGMVLSPIGKVVEECWRAIPDHYKNVSTGVFAVMPDHFHGIIVIGTGIDGTGIDGTGHFVGTGHAPSQRQPAKPAPTIGNIVGSFKSAATKKIRETGCRDFGWQERFYDRVIRNAYDLQRIEQYIRMNPEKWGQKRKHL